MLLSIVCTLNTWGLQVVDDAIGAGVDGYDADMKQAVRNGVNGLRLSIDSALSIASKAVRRFFDYSVWTSISPTAKCASS